MKLVDIKYTHSADSLTPAGRLEGSGFLQFIIDGVARGKEQAAVDQFMARLKRAIAESFPGEADI